MKMINSHQQKVTLSITNYYIMYCSGFIPCCQRPDGDRCP